MKAIHIKPGNQVQVIGQVTAHHLLHLIAGAEVNDMKKLHLAVIDAPEVEVVVVSSSIEAEEHISS